MKNKPLTFIELTAADGRTTSLSFGGRIDRGMLNVLGNLPHNEGIKPKTRKDRDMLVKWLNELDYGT